MKREEGYNKQMKQSLYVFCVIAVMLPGVALAQLGDIDTFFIAVIEFINNILIPLVIGMALLMFVYGLYRWFILGGGNENDRAAGRQLALWSIVAFFLMVTIWGIVLLVADGLGFYNGSPAELDELPRGYEI
jgi:predicted PurR-regulated permease PerM